MDGSTRALLVSVLAASVCGMMVSVGFALQIGHFGQGVLVMVMGVLLVVTLASAFVAGFLYAPPLSYVRGDIRWGADENDERGER